MTKLQSTPEACQRRFRRLARYALREQHSRYAQHNELKHLLLLVLDQMTNEIRKFHTRQLALPEKFFRNRARPGVPHCRHHAADPLVLLA